MPRAGKSGRAPFPERIAGWSVRHRARAVTAWFTLVAAAVIAAALMTGEQARSVDPGDSGRAKAVLDAQQTWTPIVESVLVQHRGSGGKRLLDDPHLRAAVQDLVTALRGAPDAVAGVRSPLEPDAAAALSADGASGLVTFQVAGPNAQTLAHYDRAVRAVDAAAARHPGVRMVRAGDRSLAVAVDERVQRDFQRAEFISLPLTVVILLIVFGSLVAVGASLLVALSTLAGAFGLLQVVAYVVPVNSAGSAIVLLIGVAVGVDYSLFYLRRVREERAAGHDLATALRITARTSGHVVVVSGLTVMLCLSGLVLTGLDNFTGAAVGIVLAVGLAVIGSVTVLPALLALLGDRVDRGRIPGWGRRRTGAAESRFWSVVAAAVIRRPLVWGLAGTLALVAVALPALGMRMQDATPTDSLPRSVPAVDAAVRMQQAFPGARTPARVVIWDSGGGAVDRPAVRAAIAELRTRAAGSGGAFGEPLAVLTVDRVLVVLVPLAGSGTDPTSVRTLRSLREQVLPATLGRVPGVEIAVAGRTAWAADFADRVHSRTPLVFGFVLTLAFVLLVVTFRAPAIAFVSIVLNLLSVAAAYGVLTWAVQDGHLAGVLGFTSYGAVSAWLPLLMFVILFGLSMDYHLFILSRIRERWAAGVAPAEAIVGGVASSAGVVTSAAAIMVAVFSVFITLSAIEHKMMGIGLAAAVLIDATVVRGVLLPAALALLGDRAWTLRAAGRRAGGPADVDRVSEPGPLAASAGCGGGASG